MNSTYQTIIRLILYLTLLLLAIGVISFCSGCDTPKIPDNTVVILDNDGNKTHKYNQTVEDFDKTQGRLVEYYRWNKRMFSKGEGW